MENNISIDIWIGVLSGVLTSVFLALVYLAKEKWFDPWLENRLYKGVILEGTWVSHGSSKHECPACKDSSKHELDFQLDLRQSGYKIKGIFCATSCLSRGKEKDNYSNIYNVSGHIQDNYVTLEYNPLSRKRTGQGVFLMEVKNGGKNLMGDITFLSEDKMEIATLPEVVLFRNSSD